ncbi:MAG: hypothetical protein E6K18_02145 [Methanobacteriota archaeon]|nr:MAG: hypothetical protein E6K18_02145 [Euryarchaeota archaeon]
MSHDGFESFVDAIFLLIVLFAASGVMLTRGLVSEHDPRSDGVALAGNLRLALFRTTLDGLGYRQGATDIEVRNGTTVETFLRLEVHLLRNASGDVDFGPANVRIGRIVARLLPSGWSGSVFGGLVGEPVVVQLPAITPSPDRFESRWAYAPVHGVGPGTELGVLVWLSPRR